MHFGSSRRLRTRLVEVFFQRRVRLPYAALAAALLFIASTLGPPSALASFVSVSTTSNGTAELNYYADLYGTNRARSYSAGISGSRTIAAWCPTIAHSCSCMTTTEKPAGRPASSLYLWTRCNG